MGVIFLILFIICTAAGAGVGCIRRFSKTAVAGVAVVFTLLLERAIGSGISKTDGSYALTVLISTIALLLLFCGLFQAFKIILIKQAEVHRTLSHYKNQDAVDEAEAYIMNALDKKDKKEYRRRLRARRRIKDKAGVWGVMDVVFGGLFGALNAAVVCACIIMGVIMFCDLFNFEFIMEVASSNAWLDFGSGIALDTMLIGLFAIGIKAGYRNGIGAVVSFAVVVGLVGIFAYGSIMIASSDMCASSVAALQSGLLGGVPGDLGVNLAKIILAGLIFLLSLIVIVLVAVFFPKLIEKFRENGIYCVVDGVLGAIILFAVLLAALLAIGGVAYTLNDLPFMSKFGEYSSRSYFADCMYRFNPLADVFQGLPFRGWFQPSAPAPVE